MLRNYIITAWTTKSVKFGSSWIQSPFYLPCKNDFSIRLQIFLHAGWIFCLPKNYNPMQKMMSVVIDVYKFGQEIFSIGTFWYFLYNDLNRIPVIAAENAFLQHGRNHMQPAQIKLHPDENFLQHAKIQSSYFAG